MVKIVVDDREIETEEGNNLLRVCLENGIEIPNLCYLKDMDPPASSCRLCFVEIEGRPGPVTSCTVPVVDGLVVKTDTPEVRKLQRSALQLLLTVHKVECKDCPANKKCDLQKWAKFLSVGLKPKKLPVMLKDRDVDSSHPFLDYYPNRCVLCGRCVAVCRSGNQHAFLTFANRGFETVIAYFGAKNLSTDDCVNCKACVDVCPVSALIPREG